MRTLLISSLLSLTLITSVPDALSQTAIRANQFTTNSPVVNVDISGHLGADTLRSTNGATFGGGNLSGLGNTVLNNGKTLTIGTGGRILGPTGVSFVPAYTFSVDSSSGMNLLNTGDLELSGNGKRAYLTTLGWMPGSSDIWLGSFANYWQAAYIGQLTSTNVIATTVDSSSYIKLNGTNVYSIKPGSNITFTTNNTIVTISSVTPVYLGIAASDEVTALTTGTNKVTFRSPFTFTLTSVRGSLTTNQTSGSVLTFDVLENGTTVFSTKPTFDNNEKTTTTAATPSVLSDTTIADDSEITVNITQVGTSGATGLKVWLIGTKP